MIFRQILNFHLLLGTTNLFLYQTTVRVYVSNLDTSKVDTKPHFQANLTTAENNQNSAIIEIHSDSDSDNYSAKNTIPI